MANYTPRKFAFITSLLVASLVLFLYALVVWILEENCTVTAFVSLYLLMFLATYFIVVFFLEKFIYRKIKIIYKTIHNSGGQRDTKPKVDMGIDVLGEVNKEVNEWVEAQDREVKTMKAAEKFRKEFIGNLAHELKTPVFNIQGYVETLLESDPEDSELRRKFLMRASSNVDRISNLIKDIDQISSIESGAFPINYSRFDIVELAKKTMESLDHLAREKEITLRLKYTNEKSIYVEADQNRIEQVLTNLIMNSIFYGKEKGETRIRFYDMDDNVLVEVADNGIGISKEHLPRIFERFYRVDKSRSRNEGGSGLGLSICKHIIESHNQKLTVYTNEGEGTTFGFTLKKQI